MRFLCCLSAGAGLWHTHLTCNVIETCFCLYTTHIRTVMGVVFILTDTFIHIFVVQLFAIYNSRRDIWIIGIYIFDDVCKSIIFLFFSGNSFR